MPHYVDAGGEGVRVVDDDGRVVGVIPPEDLADERYAVPPEKVVSPAECRRLVAEGRRQRAYAAEADSFRDRAVSYQKEAEAWRNAGNGERATDADAKADAALALYLERKEAIRRRFPYGDEADEETERFALMPTGTYHRPSCPHAGDSAESLTLEEIAGRDPDARPCGTCKPPAAGE